MSVISTDILEALKSPLEEDRHDALNALRRVDLSESGAYLLYAMGDESWRVRKEAVDVFVSAMPDDSHIEMLLELLRNWDNAGLRNSAAEAAIRLGRRVTAPLMRRIHDGDEDVRKFVVDVMGAIGTPDFVPTLLEALHDSDVNVAAAAAEHLGNMGCTSVVPKLIAAIVENDAVFFRFNALAALGKLATPAAVPVEITRLAGEEILCKAVYDCLGSIADHSVAPLVLDGFSNRKKSSRCAAVKAFVRIIERSSGSAREELEQRLKGLSGSDAVASLAELVEGGDLVAAEAATVLLGIIGDERSVPALLSAYAIERLSSYAVKSLRIMGASGLASMVSSYDAAGDAQRGVILSLIGELSYLAGASLVIAALRDRSPLVRREAVTSVGRLELAASVPVVVELLNDPDDDVRNAALACLQSLSRIDRAAVEEVAHHLAESESPEQRRDAAILIAAMGDAMRLSLLTKDENPGVRQASVAALGRLKCTDAAGTLKIALADEDPEVRVAAAEALGELGTPENLQALELALSDDDPWVRCAALGSIVSIAPSGQGMELVRRMSGDTSEPVVFRCLELLERYGTPQAAALISSLAASSNPDIAEMAQMILSKTDTDTAA